MAKKPTFGEFLHSFVTGHWGVHMTGPLTVPFTLLALLLPATWAKIIFGAIAAFAALLGSYGIWSQERKALVDSEERIKKLTEHPDIDIAFKAGYIDPVNIITLTGGPAVNLNDSLVTLELLLENRAQVPTNIEVVGMDIEVREDNGGKFKGSGQFLRDQLGYYVEKVVIPGSQPTDYSQQPIDFAITTIDPLKYGIGKTCWAKFFVPNLLPGTYTDAYIVVTLVDGTGKSHTQDGVLNLQYGEMKKNP